MHPTSVKGVDDMVFTINLHKNILQNSLAKLMLLAKYSVVETVIVELPPTRIYGFGSRSTIRSSQLDIPGLWTWFSA